MADEVLYQARIHPSTPANKLTPEQVGKLVEVIAYVLGTAVALDARNEDFPKDWLFHYRYTAILMLDIYSMNISVYVHICARLTLTCILLLRWGKRNGSKTSPEKMPNGESVHQSADIHAYTHL